MPSSKPALEVWDSCCIIGILNGEKDKLPALLSYKQSFETGLAMLGIPSAAASEIVLLSDGSPAHDKVQEFLSNPYVQLLLPTQEVVLRSSKLQFRFDHRQTPDFKDKAIAAGVPKDQAHRLKSKDSEILATALVYKALRLTTYDPLLIFIGSEYITAETGLVIAKPDASMLPFEGEGETVK
jgi:hypothetical protein